MRQRYVRMVELGNEGARQLGYADVGALWRSNYDMPPDQFAKEEEILIRGQNTPCRETFLMHVTSWRAFYNFSFDEHCAGRRELLGRCIGARFMETRRPE